MTLQTTKQQIREQIIAARNQLPESSRQSHSAQISQRLLQLPAYQQAKVVLAYMNFGTEFDSANWAQRVLDDNKLLLLPKVNQLSGQLDLYWVFDLQSQLAGGAWGILEPSPEHCERLNTLNRVEFALLPGVAFTREGARLGYGGGYYDKLLAQMSRRPPLIAAGFGIQLVEHLPQEATDVKVDWIVTEQEIIACGQHIIK
jgi:5-formyltetrahydrofolate cyclo-ligase